MRTPPLSLTHKRYAVAPVTADHSYVGVAEVAVFVGAIKVATPEGGEPPPVVKSPRRLHSVAPAEFWPRTHQWLSPVATGVVGVTLQIPPPLQPSDWAVSTRWIRVPRWSSTHK